MPILQSSTIEFGMTVKPADFESLPVKVILTGLITDRADLELLGDMAYVECMRLVNRELERRGIRPQAPAAPSLPVLNPAVTGKPEPVTRAKRQPIVIGEPKGEGPTQAAEAAPTIQAAPQEPAPVAGADHSGMTNEQLQAFIVAKYASATERAVPPVVLREIVDRHIKAASVSQVYDLKDQARHALVVELEAV